MYRADTIVACATPGGRGAISIVRCSGPDALAIAATVFRPRKPGSLEPWHMRLGTVVAADGTTPVDDVLAVCFPRPLSFSGEDTFEIHCHGSPVVVEQIVASVIGAGARAAERGEFTRRAVLNGKLDLLQAEAISDLIDARMAAGARAAWRQLQGALSEELSGIRRMLVAVLAEIEAAVDFTDDELPDPDVRARCEAIDAAAARVESLLSGYPASRRQREGLGVVFIGRPNAGKSSLVNRLLGSGRMIVSEEPGTTRDVVEEVVDLGGIAFVLTDTAGIREADGAAETQAVERARDSARLADLRVYVVDVTLPIEPDDGSLWESVGGADTIVVLNKIDAGDSGPWRAFFAARGADVIETSARSGAGCDSLADALSTTARRRLEADPVGISRVRHRSALERTIGPLARARQLAKSDDAIELVAMELREALAELAGIGTAVDNEEVLDRIFSEFCIGK